jgi:hypothetical protein
MNKKDKWVDAWLDAMRSLRILKESLDENKKEGW